MATAGMDSDEEQDFLADLKAGMGGSRSSGEESEFRWDEG